MQQALFACQLLSKTDLEKADLEQLVRQTAGQGESERQKILTLRSPNDGTIPRPQHSITPPGQYLLASQKVAEVSPSKTLVAKAWLLPKNIGHLQPD